MKLYEPFASLPAIRTLVREHLHCNCPEAVFDDVRIGIPSLFGTHGVNGGLEILVGQRLLITLVPLTDLPDPVASVTALLQAGRTARDAHGLNRFRLVIVGSPDAATRCGLKKIAEKLEDKIHLHVLETDDFEKYFVP